MSFQSSVSLPTGLITSPCPDTNLPTCVEIDTPAGMGSVTGAYSGVAEYLDAVSAICGSLGIPVDTQSLDVCTDGSGDIFLYGSSNG